MYMNIIIIYHILLNKIEKKTDVGMEILKHADI